MRKIFIWMAIFTLMLAITACSSKPATTTTVAPSSGSLDGAALVQERCTACHTLSRVESKKLTSGEWEAIVDGMIGKGAKLSADEKILVVDYLAATYGQ